MSGPPDGAIKITTEGGSRITGVIEFKPPDVVFSSGARCQTATHTIKMTLLTGMFVFYFQSMSSGDEHPTFH